MFRPLPMRSLTLRNRIFVSPMCMYSSEDGFVNDWHVIHYGSRAVGGAGAIVFEATAVESKGRISPEDLGIWKDEHIAGLARIVSFIKEQGAAAGIQLAHAGRKACTLRPWEGRGAVPADDSRFWPDLVSASAIPTSSDDQTPLALDEEGIEGVIASFAAGARRAREAGFDFVEVHGAHGYLVHQFLSPITNQRTDQYGGCLENRARFLYRVVHAVRNEWPEDKPLLVRLSATDYIEGGWTTDECIQVCQELKKIGVDMVDVSSGGLDKAQKLPPASPSYQVDFATRIKQEAEILTVAVGSIIQPELANSIVEDGRADAIAIARASLDDAYWPRHAAKALNAPLDDMAWPSAYHWALTKWNSS